MRNESPRVGQLVRVYGVWCRILVVRAFGTIDVEALDDSGRCWRVSGLPFIRNEEEAA